MLAGHTTARDASRCMDGHQWTQTITAFATKAWKVATKSHMLNFCEGLPGLCRDMLRLWSIETNNARNKKDFLSSENKNKAKNKKKITTTFGKSLFLIEYRTRYAIYMAPNTKDLAINQTRDGCLWKPAKRNSVCVSKQLRFVAITETFIGNQA